MKQLPIAAIILLVATYCTSVDPNADERKYETPSFVDPIYDSSLESELTKLGLDSAQARAEVDEAKAAAKRTIDSMRQEEIRKMRFR